jgi:hypothetical protein
VDILIINLMVFNYQYDFGVFSALKILGYPHKSGVFPPFMFFWLSMHLMSLGFPNDSGVFH